MIQALGSSSLLGIAPQAPSPGVLQVQLAKVEAQLQACVTCDSARTPEGQAQILALARQVQTLKARLEGPRTAPAEAPAPLPGGSLDLRV